MRQKHFYEFGRYSLDASNRLLFCDGETVPLQPKAVDTLLLLIERRGEVLSKDDLMRELWPDSFVEESNLSQNIYLLRKALGQAEGGSEFIRTVPKRGYRFVASVEERWKDAAGGPATEGHAAARVATAEEGAAGEKEAAPDTERAPTPPGRRESAAAGSAVASPAEPARSGARAARTTRPGLLALALSAGLLLAAGAAWRYARHNPPEQPALDWRAALRISQLVNVKSSPGGGIFGASFSPDGRLIAYSTVSDGENNLWVKQLAGGEPVRITNDEWRDRNPIWSADGQQLAFLSDRGGEHGIWSIPFLGGTPTLLKAIHLLEGRLVAWSADGRTIYFELRRNLHALDIASGETARLTDFDPEHSSARDFAVSPDESLLAYTDVDEKSHVYVMPLRGGGAPRRVTGGAGDDRQPAWFRDGSRLAYSSDRGGVFQICVAYLDGRESVQVTFGDGDSEFPAVSPDGGRILFVSQKDNANLFSCDVETGEEVGQTSSFGLQLWPAVSPDGGRVAFQSSGTSAKLWEGSIVIKSRADAQLTQVAAGGYDVSWSPSGDALAFLRASAEGTEVWRVSAAGRDEKQLTSGGVLVGGVTGVPYNRMLTNYQWSPDGAKIAYCSAKSGQANLWVVGADGSGDEMITDNTDDNLELASPLWSPDGTSIAYVARTINPPAGGRVVRSVRVSRQGASETVLQSDAPLRLVGWSASGQEIFGAASERKGSALPQEVSLLRVPVAGRPETLARVDSSYLHNIRLSPDGRTIALVSRRERRDNVTLIPTGGGPARKVTGNTDPTVYYSGLAWSPDGKSICFSRQTTWALISVIENFK